MKTPHYLTPLTPMLTDDVCLMSSICHGIADRRAEEARILPAPEGWVPEPPTIATAIIIAALVLLHLGAVIIGFLVA